jgi:hypothetical protein
MQEDKYFSEYFSEYKNTKHTKIKELKRLISARTGHHFEY